MTWASFAGLAVLIGAASIGVVMCALAVFGAQLGVQTLAVVAGALGAAGVAIAFVVPKRHLDGIRFPIVGAQRGGSAGATVEAAAATIVACVCVLTVFAAFRSSPWLNDSYSFWLPKGLLLAGNGLDERWFTESDRYFGFIHADYPLWWSIVSGVEMQLVGSVDLRVMNALTAVLLVAFVASAARLLWGRVRPWIVWVSLALLVVSPELCPPSCCATRRAGEPTCHLRCTSPSRLWQPCSG